MHTKIILMLVVVYAISIAADPTDQKEEIKKVCELVRDKLLKEHMYEEDVLSRYGQPTTETLEKYQIIKKGFALKAYNACVKERTEEYDAFVKTAESYMEL